MDGVDVTRHGAGRARRGDGVPELCAVPAHDGGGEHRLSAEDGRHAARRRSRRRWRDAAAKVEHRPPAASAGRASCPAASSSAARWRAPSCGSRGCSCWTSRCPTSTPSCAWRRGSSCSKLQRALGVTTVYVTHDQEEAMTLADRMAVFMDGRIVQVGTPREIFRRPAHGGGGRLHRHAADEPAAGDAGAGSVAVSTASRMPVGAGRRRSRARSCSACGPATCASAADGIAGARGVHRGARRQQHRRPRRPPASACKLKADGQPPAARRRDRAPGLRRPRAAHLFDRASGAAL